MRLVVTGLNGQVVTSLIERGSACGHEIIAIGRPRLDLAEPETVFAAMTASGADAVISAAAYTAVDLAEGDADAAFAVNATGVAALADAVCALGVPLIHLSTDYVFDGVKESPYVETDPTNPVSVYGASKLAGEQAITTIYAENSVILRTAWVYGASGANFVRTMLRLAAERDIVSVVADQYGNPTSSLDIADGLIAIAEGMISDRTGERRGVFHMTAAGEASWAGFARHIFAASAKLGGPTATVKSIRTEDYPTLARRPANSRLNCDKLAEAYGLRLPGWEVSTEQVIARLLGATN